MEPSATLIRSPKDRRLPRAILRLEARPSHRPRAAYRLVLRDADDVARARAAGLPVFGLTGSVVTMLGYPMRLPLTVLLARSWRTAVETELPTVEFLSERAVADPGIEDLVVAMLRIDPIAARALAERNGDLIDRGYLLKRLFQEDLEDEAARVRFRELLPALPESARPLPRQALDRVLAANPPGGRLP